MFAMGENKMSVPKLKQKHSNAKERSFLGRVHPELDLDFSHIILEKVPSLQELKASATRFLGISDEVIAYCSQHEREFPLLYAFLRNGSAWTLNEALRIAMRQAYSEHISCLHAVIACMKQAEALPRAQRDFVVGYMERLERVVQETHLRLEESSNGVVNAVWIYWE